MNKILKVSLVILGVALLAFAVYFFSVLFKPKKAGIYIETTPKSLVFINGTQVGKTPYDSVMNSGEITLKLVPEVEEKPLAFFESKVTLNPKVKTVVKREFGETQEVSSGEIISFEKTPDAEASFAIVANPDSAQIIIDGTARGFAPYKTASITAANHQIVVSALGYQERTMVVKTVLGYKLTAIVKLAPSQTVEAVSSSPTPEPTPIVIVMIEILETPSGFLRVREESNTTSRELARVKPGEKFKLIEEDAKTGWLKIEYLTNQFGWVSNEFARKVNEGRQ